MAVPKHWKDTFIAALRNSGNVRASCLKAGIDRASTYKARQRHPAFAARWDEAVQEAVDLLEATAWKRATAVKGASDGLLMFLLKAHRRAFYGESATIGATPELLSALERLAEIRQQRGRE